MSRQNVLSRGMTYFLRRQNLLSHGKITICLAAEVPLRRGSVTKFCCERVRYAVTFWATVQNTSRVQTNLIMTVISKFLLFLM